MARQWPLTIASAPDCVHRFAARVMLVAGPSFITEANGPRRVFAACSGVSALRLPAHDFSLCRALRLRVRGHDCGPRWGSQPGEEIVRDRQEEKRDDLRARGRNAPLPVRLSPGLSVSSPPPIPPGKWKAGPALYPICLGARCLLPRLDSALLQGRNACLKPGRPFLQRSGRSGDTGKFVPCAQQCLAPASHLASSQPREENRARIPALPFYRRRFQCSNSYRAFFGALLSESFCSPAVLV
ncbi:hypothetical protein HPB51_001416 [Rhipicephalus microplus]|uniref:Uncharacterized protein n=1 Tax=Rhipicephalus microplus TaxID=6941 RepID=A0A9J6EED4_RHIMP|nr:hypothetical protein HPB51_001416 [Rhipicephalus microplus]